MLLAAMYFLGPKITFLLQVDQFSVVTSSGIDEFENDDHAQQLVKCVN